MIDPNRTRLISHHGFALEETASVEDSLTLIRKHINVALTSWARWGNA